LTRNHR